MSSKESKQNITPVIGKVSAAIAKANDFIDFVNESPTRKTQVLIFTNTLIFVQHTTLSKLPYNDSPKLDSKR
jgi:hypothetical protein